MKYISVIITTLLLSTVAHADDAEEIAAMFINLNGLLCAEVLELNALNQKDVYEVTCTKYRGGNSQATYILDMKTGAAWED